MTRTKSTWEILLGRTREFSSDDVKMSEKKKQVNTPVQKSQMTIDAYREKIEWDANEKDPSEDQE